MDGWHKNLGGNSQGHRPIAPFSRSPYQRRFLNSGIADPRDLDSHVVQLVTRQLKKWWAALGSPGPPGLPQNGNFGHPAPPPPPGADRDEGREGGWEGGRGGSTNAHTPCLGASLAPQHARLLPQAIPIGATQRGATHYGCCRTNRAPGRREERGRGLEEERGLGNFRRPGPALGAICWAPLSSGSPLRVLEPRFRSVGDG